MRNPNGYGGVYKISGKRRRPFCIRLTDGWTDEGKQRYKNLGYYKTRKEAILALAEYNQNPYSFHAEKFTFGEVYEKWSEERFPKLSRSNVYGYKAAYKLCSTLYGLKFVDIRKVHLQKTVDTCGKNYPTLRKLKVLYNQLFKFAMENDIVSKDYSKFVDIGKKTYSNARKPFAAEEIKKLWDVVAVNEYVQVILMLIYSGVRISELLDLKKEHVNLDDRYFDVVASKTESGIRKVPIAKKTLPFFQNWMSKDNDCLYLLNTPEGSHLQYRNYYDSYWKPFFEELNITHRPHDTRHTTVSLLAVAKVDPTIIKKIVGHAGAMNLTERVYTHFEIQPLLEAIDSI